MTDSPIHDPASAPGGLSRRQLIAGLGAASGAAGLLAALPGGSVVAGPAEPSLGPAPAQFPQVLAPVVPALTYAQLDAYAFFGGDTGTMDQGRSIEVLSGNTPTGMGGLVAPLPIPSGSRIRQINVSYFGRPTPFIYRRPLAAPRGDQVAYIGTMLPEHVGSEPRAESVSLDVPLLDNVGYTLRFDSANPFSIFAATVGYVPPTQGFVPLDPPTRPLDTRQPGQGPKLQPAQPRILDLGIPAGARGAVINLTITETETDFGFVSVYRADIPFPGNSSINWSSPNQTSANAVITAVDEQGRIALRAGEAATSVVVDVLGILV